MVKAHRGQYPVTKNESIADGIYELCFEAPDIARAANAGQFANVYLPGGAMLLPRPISIADVRGDVVTLVYAIVGGGTKALAGIKAGARLEIMGPLGTGYFDYAGSPTDAAPSGAFENPFTALLVGGGVGAPPLHFAARRIRAARRGRVKIVACLGFRGHPWYREEFERVCDEVLLASEAEGAAAFHGNVAHLLDKSFPYKEAGSPQANGQALPSLALACGPRPMLKAASDFCAAKNITLRVSLEERMGCGYGACAGCTCKTRLLGDVLKPQNGPNMPNAEGFIKKKVCAHGPVFWADEVVW
ncbi:MAG: dihydroorotate dehydrogenase electron transfer subunit [Clostridiales Family XIII bacterium]|jgi:dihydroorotate dehydrogenase electron transfer subunit|nr:dihydroorotate dehydrogenase electron transfer subunit [Clostridiales Family XIII bacterium]